jgi:hypothetical protein
MVELSATEKPRGISISHAICWYEARYDLVQGQRYEAWVLYESRSGKLVADLASLWSKSWTEGPDGRELEQKAAKHF